MYTALAILLFKPVKHFLVMVHHMVQRQSDLEDSSF